MSSTFNSTDDSSGSAPHPNTTQHGNDQQIIASALGPFDRLVPDLPLFGFPGPLFRIIHITALSSLSISVAVCVLLIIYLFCIRDREKPKVPVEILVSNPQTTPSVFQVTQPRFVLPRNLVSFWKWSFGERLVIYVALTDLGFSSFHLIDRSYYIHFVANPPDGICSMVGFFHHEFMLAHWIIVSFTALNACSLVVFNRKLRLGRWDWKLILVAFGTPLVIGAISLRLGLFGQSGAWFVT